MSGPYTDVFDKCCLWHTPMQKAVALDIANSTSCCLQHICIMFDYLRPMLCLTACIFRVPRLNLGNVRDNDDSGVDYTIAMESPLVAAAAGYGYCSLNFSLRLVHIDQLNSTQPNPTQLNWKKLKSLSVFRVLKNSDSVELSRVSCYACEHTKNSTQLVLVRSASPSNSWALV